MDPHSHKMTMRNGLEDVTGACDYLKVSRGKLYKLMSEGRLAYVKIDACRRIPKEELMRFARDCLIIPEL